MANTVNLRFLIFCYKEMSNMIINYNKSETIMVQMSKESGEGVAYTFNCKMDLCQ